MAKEAADMVTTDDNFATIFHAVEEGRIIFDNIRKVIFFLIPTGVAAIGSILLSIFLDLPIPYTPSQILWINLVTNGFQVIALTFEPGEKGVIHHPPRDPGEGIMSRVLIERTVLVGLLISVGVICMFVYSLKQGASLEEARTVAVTTMVFFQFFQAVNSRSETESILRLHPLGNPMLAYGLFASVLAHLGSITWRRCNGSSIPNRSAGEIGVRKALGARRRDIMAQFVVESATLSTFGAILGIGTGIGLAFFVKAVTPFPAAVAPWSVGLAVFLGVAVGMAAGIYPASRASRLDPIAALRAE